MTLNGASVDTVSFTLQLAAQMVSRYGKAAIWKLHVAAATRHRHGDSAAAEALVEAAEVIERLWLDDEPRPAAHRGSA